MARVAVGGTFDPLHDGHKALLRKAIELSKNGELVVGITSNVMVQNKSHEVADYTLRCERVRRFIQSYGINPTMIKLEDAYGPTIYESFDFLVVSPETYEVALSINRIRRTKGLKEIKIVVVDFVLAEDGLPITSTRIKQGIIDEHGRLI